MRNQNTLREPVSFQGKGLFSNEFSEIVVRPASANTGIVFRRKEINIPAKSGFILDESVHATSVSKDNICVRGIEHLLSALYGCRIDNALIEVVKGYEIPFMDGKASEVFSNSFINSGICSLNTTIQFIKIQETFLYSSKESWAVLSPSPHLRLTATVHIEFPSPIGSQLYCFDHINRSFYTKEIAWARSFLRYGNDKKWQDGRTHWQLAKDQLPLLPDDPNSSPILCYNKTGWITQPRHKTEPIRHKLLDLIGDLALIGKSLFGNLVVHYPGHVFNCKLANVIDRNLA